MRPSSGRSTSNTVPLSEIDGAAPAQEPVLDDERVPGDDEVRPVPAADRGDGDQRGETEQDRSGGRDGRPRREEARRTRERENERAQQRARERDPVPVRLEDGRIHGRFASSCGRESLAK